MEARCMTYTLNECYNNIVNVLIVTDVSQRTPYGEEIYEKKSKHSFAIL